MIHLSFSQVLNASVRDMFCVFRIFLCDLRDTRNYCAYLRVQGCRWICSSILHIYPTKQGASPPQLALFACSRNNRFSCLTRKMNRLHPLSDVSWTSHRQTTSSGIDVTKILMQLSQQGRVRKLCRLLLGGSPFATTSNFACSRLRRFRHHSVKIAKLMSFSK